MINTSNSNPLRLCVSARLSPGRAFAFPVALVGFSLAACHPAFGQATAPDDAVLRAESALIKTIEHISPAAVCIHDQAQRGGGSGVLIDSQGYGLTNYHVVAGMMEKRRGFGGLSDGRLYELDVLGIDPVGDVAMFRLKPEGDGEPNFPFAVLGDSDRVQLGDTVIAAGNPFILSEDYTPSISVGVVSGTHRYQKGVGGNLIYSDCLQVDAAINPGNSGGALFNADGEIVGINGRISVGSRGRLNVGHGYAISINQIRRFIPAMRAGLLARHGTLGVGAIEPEIGRVLFVDVVGGGAADRAGIRNGDRLVRFDGEEVRTQNRFASMLGTYPEDWPVPLVIESDGKMRELTVRLDPVNPKMRFPFTVDREVIGPQTREVLSAFRRAVFREASTRVPPEWSWTATRTYDEAADPRREPEVYDVAASAESPIRMTRRNPNGSIGPVIVYDEASATKRSAIDDTAMDLPTPERIALNAIHVLRNRLFAELTDDQLAEVSLAGADAPAVAFERRAVVNPLVVVDWLLGGHTLAKFSFETDTGRLVRVRVRDIATNEQATIELSDYQWAAGYLLPHTLHVRSGNIAYRETLSDWNFK